MILFCGQIHWFSIFNSFMMVIFLTGLVSMILMRTLRKDYAKYAREEDDLEALVIICSHCVNLPSVYRLFLAVAAWNLYWCFSQERDVNEESGWKLVHGDVFRPPQSLALLSALVGTGAQLAMLVLLVILLAIVGTLYVGYVNQRTQISGLLFISVIFIRVQICLMMLPIKLVQLYKLYQQSFKYEILDTQWLRKKNYFFDFPLVFGLGCCYYHQKCDPSFWVFSL